MINATRMRDAPQADLAETSPADSGRGARESETMSNVVAGRAAHGSSRVFDPRILLVLLSALLFVPVLSLFYWPTTNGVDVIGYPIGRDFINIWVGPRLAFGDQLWALFDLKAYNAAIGTQFGQPLPTHGWSYPLFVLPAFWPLAQLPYFTALAVWTFGLFAIFAGVTLWQIERPMRPLALLLLLLAPATLINIVGGQNGFLTAALLLGGIRMLDRRPLLAGILFGLLTFKPQMGLVLPFALVALGAWRTIAVAAVTAIALVAVSLAAFGPDAWRAYFEVTSAYQISLIEQFQAFGTLMMVSVLAAARTFGLSQPLALAIQVAVAIPVLALAMVAVRLTEDSSRRAFVLVTATVLVTPYALNYDLAALTAVILWRLTDPQPVGLIRGVVLALGWLIPLGAMYLNNRGIGLTPVVFAGLFALALHDAVPDLKLRVWALFPKRLRPAGPLQSPVR
jgi:hypothetical protein